MVVPLAVAGAFHTDFMAAAVPKVLCCFHPNPELDQGGGKMEERIELIHTTDRIFLLLFCVTVT